jgi:hypothetical protein
MNTAICKFYYLNFNITTGRRVISKRGMIM